MNRRVVWHQRALDDLAAIARRDQRTAARISSAVDQLAEQNVGDVRKLSGDVGEYRLRVGEWRVLFTFEDRGQTMLVSTTLAS